MDGWTDRQIEWYGYKARTIKQMQQNVIQLVNVGKGI